jgi:2-oxoglutarate ferredoxin oxidoreductase subunit alpha
VIPPTYSGGERPDLLLVTWGSTIGSVREVQGLMAAEGRNVATLCFSQVWPLVPANFMSFLERARDVVSIEGNATAQFARLIRRETGFEIKRRVLRYDGLPITPEFILRGIDG